jgi:glycosyltransferase involved in cell wall biosynthesis
VRGHSFDWNPGLASRVAQLPNIRRVFLFPSFAAQVRNPKIEPMPVAFSSQRFPGRFREKDRKFVLRLAAGLPSKGLHDFMRTAELLPQFKFTLVLGRAGGGTAFEHEFMRRYVNRDVRIDLSWAEAEELTRRAGIYLHTWDPARNPFGMSISIAEALSTGSLVLVRRGPEASSYLGSAGIPYSSPDEAAAIIESTQGWSEDAWEEVAAAAAARAELYRDQVVLPRLIERWQELTRPEEATPRRAD